MLDALTQLALFASKTVILFLFIAGLLILFFALIAKGKNNAKGTLTIKNLNKKYADMKETVLAEVLPKKEFKLFKKEKNKDKTEHSKNIYVVHFHGDMKASGVTGLSEEITTILNIATPKDEIIVRLESPGGFVHGYGLAAAQLMRVRAKKIPLTITIDKVAASGGYLMACVGNKVLSAPFAIIGSIGVLVQIPNFHRFLKDKHIDFVQLTAGEYKRTVTMFGENTTEGKEKLKQELEEAHQLFKNVIKENRPHLDIEKVATGEHWLGQQALGLNLVDEIKTSDDYLSECSKNANLYEICFEIKKPFLSKLSGAAGQIREKLLKYGFYY